MIRRSCIMIRGLVPAYSHNEIGINEPDVAVEDRARNMAMPN
jgi:hypothetical protein